MNISAYLGAYTGSRLYRDGVYTYDELNSLVLVAKIPKYYSENPLDHLKQPHPQSLIWSRNTAHASNLFRALLFAH